MRIYVLFGLLLALGLGQVAIACPASYVHDLYTNCSDASKKGKVGQVAERYMDNRGVDPDTAAGQIIKPYLGGTAIKEEMDGDLNLNQGVNDIVDDALGPYAGLPPDQDMIFEDLSGHGSLNAPDHFNRHFGSGIWEAQDELDPVTSDKRGG